VHCITNQDRKVWQLHRRRWIACQACPLGATATEHVLARGTLPADVLFVGEAPGESEDLLGEPFVGRSGKILDHMIRDINVECCKTFSYCITNILACRPTDAAGDDRPPTKDEAAACSPRLADFVKRCQPRIIVTLGKSAAKFLPESELPQLAITHPAYWLRTGNTMGLEYKRAKVYLKKFLREHVYS
jgi:uracil-DNA glycosylase family 4